MTERKRSKIANSEHRIGGVVYHLTRVSDAHSKWRFNQKTYPSHAAAVRAVQALKDAQVVKNHLVFNADVARQQKLVRSLPPTEGTGKPDTRPLMQQALEDLSDSDLVQLIADRRLGAELWADARVADQLEACQPAPLTVDSITSLDVDELIGATRGPGAAQNLVTWLEEATHHDMRKALTNIGFTLEELKVVVAGAMEVEGETEVQEALSVLLCAEYETTPALWHAREALLACTVANKEHHIVEFGKEVLRA
jgi:hypothetical protein